VTSRCSPVADVVNNAERRDKDLAGGKACDQGDTYLPVKSQWPDDRLDGMPQPAGKTMLDLFAFGERFVVRGPRIVIYCALT
jgi:hypothetical protein